MRGQEPRKNAPLQGMHRLEIHECLVDGQVADPVHPGHFIAAPSTDAPENGETCVLAPLSKPQVGGARPGAGRPKGSTAPEGSTRSHGKQVRLSQEEWDRLVAPYKQPGESNSDAVVRLLHAPVALVYNAGPIDGAGLNLQDHALAIAQSVCEGDLSAIPTEIGNALVPAKTSMEMVFPYLEGEDRRRFLRALAGVERVLAFSEAIRRMLRTA